ncbi:MAG: DPP IV N-terminal domain-containing protein [Bacteroidota bacterium]
MNHQKLFSFLVLTGLSIGAWAQTKMLTTEDVVMKQRTSLAPDKLMQLQWIKGSSVFSYVSKIDGKEMVIQQDAATGKQDIVFSMDEFGTLFKTLEIDVPVPQRLPFITWLDSAKFRFFYNNAFYTMNVKSKVATTITKLPKEAEEVQFNPVSSKTAFVVNNNVIVFDTNTWIKKEDYLKKQQDADGAIKVSMLTYDGGYGTVNGKTVHRSEFGIDKGLFWSPKGDKLAYYKMLEGNVTDYELMNFESKPGSFERIKYPMAGAQSHTVKLFVKDYINSRQFEVQTNANGDQYLTNVAWSPEQDAIFIAVVNRAQNEMKLNQYDGRSGAFVKTLFTETHPKYVEPECPMVFVPNDNGKFIWTSKRDGFNQLYLYDLRGKMLRQLTTGKFNVTGFLGFDQEGKNAYYMGATNNGMERQCFVVEIETGKVKQLTNAPGVHTVVLSDDGKYFIDTYSNATTPRKTVLVDQKGNELSVLLNAPNPLAAYKPCGMRLGSVMADDKVTPLNYRVFYPPQFDSTRKYPTIVYVYGGPHVQLVTNTWLGGADMWLYMMAQQGYVTFSIDNRGSGNRGADFEQATFRKLGTVERADQLTGVNFLTKQRYIDTTRMGVFGWSFGGFMSIGMMTRTDAFKVGVAGGPVIDWSLYEIMYTERYMDKPQENPEGYKDADLTNYVKNLKGKLMVIHGTDDDVVLWQHSLSYIKKCVDEGVQVDYFVYPEHKHNVLGKDRVHLMQKVTDYFNTYLK